MQKLSILSRSLSKIKHKRYELYVLSRMVEEDVALKYLNETLEIISELYEIKNQTDKWRTSFNENELDQIETYVEEAMKQSRNELLTKLQRLKKDIIIRRQNSCISTDYSDASSDGRDKILVQINNIYETWCKSKTHVALLKPHLIPLCAIKDDRVQYDAYIRNEILPEWIRLQSLCKSDRKQKELKAKTKNKKK